MKADEHRVPLADQRQLATSQWEGRRGAMPSTSGLTISVIVPVYNGGANFRSCLLSLAKLAPSPAEIIVVANGDRDGSWQLAEEFC